MDMAVSMLRRGGFIEARELLAGWSIDPKDSWAG